MRMTASRGDRGPVVRAARLLFWLALLAWTGVPAMAASVTKLYEWRDAKGVVSYSQQAPPSSARDVVRREIDTRSFTPAQQAAAKSYLGGLDAAELTDAKRFRRQVADADKSVDRALQALAGEERAFRQGRAPLAGERVGNAGGGTRLRPSYFDRQQRLELAVERARAQLADAYRARSDVKP